VLISDASLLHLTADGRTQPGNLVGITGQFLRLVAIEKGRLYPFGLEILLPAFGEGSGKPTYKLLAAAMLPDLLRLDNLKCFIQSSVGNRSFSLF